MLSERLRVLWSDVKWTLRYGDLTRTNMTVLCVVAALWAAAGVAWLPLWGQAGPSAPSTPPAVQQIGSEPADPLPDDEPEVVVPTRQPQPQPTRTGVRQRPRPNWTRSQPQPRPTRAKKRKPGPSRSPSPSPTKSERPDVEPTKTVGPTTPPGPGEGESTGGGQPTAPRATLTQGVPRDE